MRSFSAYIVLSLVLLTGFACQQGHDREGAILDSFRKEIEEIFLAHSRQTIIYAVGLKDSALVSSVAKKLAEVYQKRELPDSVAYYEQFAARFVPRSDEVTNNVYPEEIKEEYIISEREYIDFYIACKDSGQVASVALSLAELYRKREQLDSAIYYDKYALRFTQGTEEKQDLLLYSRQFLDFETIFPGSAGIVTSAKALAEIYWELGQPDSAIYYYQYALAFAKDADEKVISDRLADLCHERALQQEQALRQRLLGILKISTAVLVLGVLLAVFSERKVTRVRAAFRRRAAGFGWELTPRSDFPETATASEQAPLDSADVDKESSAQVALGSEGAADQVPPAQVLSDSEVPNKAFSEQASLDSQAFDAKSSADDGNGRPGV